MPTPLSRRAWLRLTAGASVAALTSPFPEALGQIPTAAAGGSRLVATFSNPLFAGESADPTILRVGEDFYITHTSYRYAPGLRVWHSRDLVNWMPLSYALKHAVGEVYAPDLAEHDGRYFIYYPADGNIFVVHADHPSGPWSEPIDLKIKNIDPGHVVGPDGARYLYSSGGHVIGLRPDGLATVGESSKVYDGWSFPKDWQTEGTWLESPKLTRRGDYYYLICAEGGTAGPPTSHMAVVARSRSPLGPWENSPFNPLIHTYSADEEWWSVGHGSLVSTPDERWYFVYHGYRKDFSTLGRQTLMEPVEWTADGWPRAPLGTLRAAPMPAPMGIGQRPMIDLSDPFTGPVLQATWAAWNETDLGRFRTGGGSLTIQAKGNAPGESSPLTVTARDEAYEVQVAVTPPARERCRPGLVLRSRGGDFRRAQRWPGRCEQVEANAGEP